MANCVGTSAVVSPTAYRVSLDRIPRDNALALDTFPVCEGVVVKPDGSNSNRLALPIKRYLVDVQTYLRQWQPM